VLVLPTWSYVYWLVPAEPDEVTEFRMCGFGVRSAVAGSHLGSPHRAQQDIFSRSATIELLAHPIVHQIYPSMQVPRPFLISITKILDNFENYILIQKSNGCRFDIRDQFTEIVIDKVIIL
ncbi:hypothetical protein, partial [Amycolatopsis tolypomycina]|uniref:hypothetical protein n=1 Tax=Amycolatopsis tolypomycina TaxID=208445 RepID=UPI0033A77865